MLIYLIIASVFVIVGAAVYGVSTLWSSQRTKQAIKTRMREVEVLRKQDATPESIEKANQSDAVGYWPILRQKLPGYQSLLRLLIQAGSEKSPGEVINLTIALGLAVLLAGFLLPFVGPLQAFILAGVAWASPLLYYRRAAEKNRVKFEEQLPEALDFLARALRAGHGLTSALSMVGDELPAPIGREFKVTFEEINFGIAFTDAMANMAARVNSTDLSFFVVALMIQRETGGNLAELLEGLAKTVRDRLKLAGKVKTISAEGKLSGYVIGGMPFALAFLLTLLNPKYMGFLWVTPEGQKLVMFGLILMAIGGFWISKIVKIKV